ncbi:unnamed protein product [Caenorhabditis auriculariae]|uniref:GDP-fucose protein O-fucosyltransferase 1 n=1 Tax=Caenorhabditis auriculariae TaxID=2777116 RepID=A0A8S1GVQ4_9PELO|nr:unnamed protein product [Caenorhabditis auriculariae]
MRWFFVISALFSVIHGVTTEIEIDAKGYVLFCPCMGRFGNQLDQLLGVMNFARSLDRTLVLPYFIEYHHPDTELIPFERIFKPDSMKMFGRVITMNDFVKHVMPKVWPKDKRIALCWTPREAIYDKTLPHGCHPHEGNPFGPYWSKVGVNFVGNEYFGKLPGAYDLTYPGSRKAWMDKYPPAVHPVLAFPSAPAQFPSTAKVWDNQRYLKWSSRVVTAAKKFINESLPQPYVGVHLRNGADWKKACEHVDNHSNKPFFASAQCLGENHHLGKLTKEICMPSKATIINQIVDEVGRTGAKSVFVSSDSNHMLDDINEALKPYDVEAVKYPSEDIYVDLALLGRYHARRLISE